MKKSKASEAGSGISTHDRIFNFLVTYKRDHNGNTPSQQEIANGCYVSPSTVYLHLLKLELEGRIIVQGRRRIDILGSTWEMASEEIPHLEPEPLQSSRREASAANPGESSDDGKRSDNPSSG